MGGKFLMVMTHGMDDPNKRSRALQLAKVAHEKGKDVTVFMMDEAVNIARKGIANTIKPTAGDEAADTSDTSSTRRSLYWSASPAPHRDRWAARR